MTRQTAAIAMLKERGCPQTSDSLGLLDTINHLESLLQDLRSHLTRFEGHYIAPPNTQVHEYNVKRPCLKKTKGKEIEVDFTAYAYYKLSSSRAIFAPSERTEIVKVIHLSKEDDPRHTEAVRGIERRNRLLHSLHQLQAAISHIQQAQNVLEN